MKILVRNVTILTMDKDENVYENGWLLTENDKISAIGSGECNQHADRIIDGRGGILLPGFVNTHCHVSMIPFRTLGDNCADRLRRFLFPLEMDAMDRKLVYLGAKYGIAEMLLSGITTFADMYYFEDEVAKACLETGIRGYLGETIIGQPTCDSLDEPYGGFKYQEKFISDYRGSDRIHPIIAPHGTTTLSPEMLRKAHDIAVKEDTIYTVHCCEMDYEMKHFAEQGQTPITFLDSIGVLDEHMLAVHCVFASDDDMELMKKRGSSIAHCIGSNVKSGRGVARMAKADELGIPFGLGTDGASSGNTLSMFDQMHIVPSAQKTANHNRSLFPAKTVVHAATAGGADALHGRTYGTLEVGKQADLVLVETQSVNMFPVFDPYSALVYSANASNVDTVLCAGKIVVQNKQLTEIDLPKLREELNESMTAFNEAAAKYKDIL